MKKVTSFLMLLVMAAGASWGQTTETIQVSTDATNPEHVYYMKNGNGRWMTGTTGPTETWANAAKFAFYAVADTTDAYKIYCVTSQKWLSYTKAGGYENKVGFVMLVDNQASAESWNFVTQDGKDAIGNVYRFAPYNNTGAASKYMNWYQGRDSNPSDNTAITVGLWQQDATVDNGSCWIVVDADLSTYTHEQSVVRLKNKSTGLYMNIASLDGTNHDAGGVQLGNKTADTDADWLKQVFYLKSTTSDDRVCKIQSVQGYYLQTFGSWGYKASATDAAGAVHTIEAVDDYYLLHTDKGYVGSNNNTAGTQAGAYMYSNHGTDNPNIKWVFEPLTSEEVANVVEYEIRVIREEYAAWVTANVGDKFGLYYVPEENKTALTEAESALGNATTVEGARAALNNCKAQYSLNGLTVGSYYRIKNTAQGLYLGIDGYTLNMKHKTVTDATTGDNDPSLVWKYEQDGDRYYLKNVYAGLYPQNIPSGQAATAKIGTGKDKAFTYAVHANPTDTEDAWWNIFFGGTQVNCEGSTNNVGNVNYWYENNAHYYIYEVSAPEDGFASMCVEWYKANPKDDETDVPATIEFDEDAYAVISPSEFVAPSIINTAIANINLAANDATQEAIYKMYEALSAWPNVDTYSSVAAANGGLHETITYNTPAGSEWGTIILPVNWSQPAGWTRKTCAAINNNVLELVDNTDATNKNTPYIVQFGEEQRGKKYQFIGFNTGAATENRTVGLLTGVLESSAKVPAGSYILSKHNDKVGFYRVADGFEYDAAQYKCYLTLPVEAARYAALFFESDMETGIDSTLDTEAKQGNGAIYNMAGQRLNRMQKGLNIVNGKIVIK